MVEVVEARGQGAVVAAGHLLACAAATDALDAGGSVVDAAIAAALALAVVCPHAATLGGDAFLLIRDARSGEIAAVNGSGRSPSVAHPSRFPNGIPRAGAQVATVPGMLAALAEARARYGRLPMDRLLAPAIALAREGSTVDGYLAANVARCADLLRPDDEAAELYLPGGTPLAEGDRLVQSDLADTLERIAREGVDVFYTGALAEALAKGTRAAGGLIQAGDLAAHRSLWQQPIAAPFHGREVLTMPPNSYGLTMLLQLLRLERDGIAVIDPDGPEFVLRGLAARRRAYAAAASVIADPEAVEQVARALLADAIAGQLPEGPQPAEAEGGTTNVTVLDRTGNAVSLVTSVSAPFGACVVAKGTGVLLNNRLRGFSLDPASPNCLAPGRRPAHTLTPAILLRDGQPEWIIGTPGTAGQTCVLAQLLARLLACGQAPRDAFAAPRWSVDLQGKPVVERDMAVNVHDAVAAREPELRSMPVGWQTFGSVKACHWSPGGLTAYADKRRSAHAVALDRAPPPVA